MLAIQALEAAADIYAYLGNATRAAVFAAAHAKSVAAVNALLWNKTLSRYHDWIDVEGNARACEFCGVPGNSPVTL